MKAELDELIGDVSRLPRLRVSGLLVFWSQNLNSVNSAWCIELKKMRPVVWYTYVLTSVFTMQI
jgi:hypothetical protein